MLAPGIAAVGVATPAPVAQQAVVDELVRRTPDLAGSRYLSIFDNAGIETRHLIQPVAWYLEPHDPSERSTLALEAGTRLAVDAASTALDRAGVAPGDVAALVVVSTTVLRAPGIDVDVTEALGLRPDVRRLQLFGMASLGGVAGLGVAADLVRAGSGPVLVVAVEANTLTFVPGDTSPETLVTLALFSDGAAAAVVAADAGDLAVVGRHTTLVPGSRRVMGFDPTDAGLAWHLAPDVPDVARERTAGSVDDALATVGWARADVDHVLLHPGGAKVLDACAQALGLEPGDLDRSFAVLAEHGNLSSGTALAVLGRFLDDGPPPGRALLTAMGPGFAYEHLLLER